MFNLLQKHSASDKVKATRDRTCSLRAVPFPRSRFQLHGPRDSVPRAKGMKKKRGMGLGPNVLTFFLLPLLQTQYPLYVFFVFFFLLEGSFFRFQIQPLTHMKQMCFAKGSKNAAFS